MGLFDGVAGAVLGKVLGGGQAGDQGGLTAIALELFNQNGGIGGILDKFKAGGLGDAAASWVSLGENLPVSADQVASVFGNSAITDLAAKFGISPDVLTSQIAQHLPEVINKVTPSGTVSEESGNLLTSILGMLK
ncbi:MAG TPA: YidB family protein [Methylophilaceae bacterium]|nr:YidB family protein [Methylophilaceae bacterium]HQC28899.1 YidB family protein [Methylotenera sp.]